MLEIKILDLMSKQKTKQNKKTPQNKTNKKTPIQSGFSNVSPSLP